MRVDTAGLRVVAADPIEVPDGHGQPEPTVEDGEADREVGTPGAYIRLQRKRRGVSLDQLAVATKIPRRQLELLEEDRYDELPGMVFTKGFLRCCARSLELDPDTVLGLLYDQERERLRARRRDTANAEPDRGAKATGRKRTPSGRQVRAAQAWLRDLLEQLPSARILMWLIVALIVAVVVLIAFTLASGQATQVPTSGL